MSPQPASNASPALRLRLPTSLREAVDHVARTGGQSRSAVVRAALVSDLTRRGLWPPKAPTDAK